MAGKAKAKAETKFTLYRNEYDALWYIINNRHQKIRIRTGGKDTGVNKSYAMRSAAEKMLERLNNGERPATVVIP
jgi:hypothetical protein